MPLWAATHSHTQVICSSSPNLASYSNGADFVTTQSGVTGSLKVYIFSRTFSPIVF